MENISSLVRSKLNNIVTEAADVPVCCGGEALLVEAGLGSVSDDENGDDVVVPDVAEDDDVAAAARTSEHPVVMALV
ncbi:MAG: hypothetical protein M1816_005366 [Peltula sp. TS41687]|nr:MAG: hypothetical protein M1816_005366 [Peltula sp. TS41687]